MSERLLNLPFHKVEHRCSGRLLEFMIHEVLRYLISLRSSMILWVHQIPYEL